MSDEGRARFVDGLYQVLEASGAATVPELARAWQTAPPAMLAAAKSLDPETRRYLLQTFRDLVALSVRNIHTNNDRLGGFSVG